MFDSVSFEDVQRDAARTAESVKAAIYYIVDLLEDHNEGAPDDEQVDVLSVIQAQKLKYIKPSGSMIANFMQSNGVYFIQVTPADSSSMLAFVLEQGYHVVPITMVGDFKSAVNQALEETIELITAAYSDEMGDEGDAEDDTTENAPVPYMNGAVPPAAFAENASDAAEEYAEGVEGAEDAEDAEGEEGTEDGEE
jgi:hypothetical protein